MQTRPTRHLSSKVVSAYRPLSKRGKADDALDEPHEGLPDHLWQPVWDWFEARLWGRRLGGEPNRGFMEVLQLRLMRDRPPLDWRGIRPAAYSLHNLMNEDRAFALDAIDFALYHYGLFYPVYTDVAEDAPGLNTYLQLGGSVWEASESAEPGRWQLSLRALGPVRESIEATMPLSERAHRHLLRAWSKLAGRGPEPTNAYREAVRAIECVAKPIVTPDDAKATLGKIVPAMRDAPTKWTFTLGDPSTVASMAGAVWYSQHDRHGTDDPEAPIDVSPEEADAAVHLAISLVRIFAGGHFQRVAGS